MTRARILLVSYHFPPTREVGAKRTAAIAELLHEAGHDVSVLKAAPRRQDGMPEPSEYESMPVFSVTVPRKWVSEAWLLVKRMLRKPEPERSEAPGKRPPAEVDTRTNLVTYAGSIVDQQPTWARRQFKAFEKLLQGEKLWLLKSLLRLLLKHRRDEFDVVIASGPPIVDYVIGLAASKLCGARLILDFRDPWWLFGTMARTTTRRIHPLQTLENRLARYCVSRSHHLVVVSPGIERYARRFYDVDGRDVSLIRNGYDEEAILDGAVPTGRLEFLYAGSLYFNRNPFPFLNALRLFCERPGIEREKIRFRLVGNCSEWHGVSVTAWLQEHGLDDVVHVLAPVDAVELRELVKDCNVMINFAQGQPLQIPAKSYEYVAYGRDVITFAEEDSDVAGLFREAGIGFIADSDGEPWAEMLNELYEKYVARQELPESRQVDSRLFGRRAQIQQYASLIEQLLAGR